ncbi:hypothetical protein GCM10010278_46580 [Streptomyces melanogenes]|nr:hypothetical protein GCM10010278_46580 [Streptomyces melanogenes]
MPHRARETGPKAREMVADLWSRSGASAAPALISAPTTSTGQGMACPAAAVAAPTPSQAAAPDSECAGPIMTVPRPISCCPVAQLTSQPIALDLVALLRFPLTG